MANYAVLRAAIENVIKTNGNNEITGQLLQNALIAMIDALGANCQFAGVATPETNPGTPDQNVMYIAGAGTYPNFGPTTVKLGEIGVFTYKGSWQYVTFPTDTTNNVVNINQIANHPSYYTTLQDAFADVPERYRKPGCITSFYILDAEGVPMRVAMMYIGDDIEDWEDADYWLNMGPVYLRESYLTDDYWVLQIGLDSNFKIIDTLQSFAKSHVLSANQGRILNEKFEGYEIEVEYIGTESEYLSRPILKGSIITKIDGATKLIFGSNEVVTTADLPYKMQNVANTVKTESGTVTNVTIGVRGIVGVDFINVNDYYGHSAAFGSALLARTEVAATERKKGLYITYLLADGWHEEQFIGTDVANWGVADNWKSTGPVDALENNNTGGEELNVGTKKIGNIDDVFNVNVYNNKANAYTSSNTARNAVPNKKRKLGAIITYMLIDGWHLEQFIATGWATEDWLIDDNWRSITVDDLILKAYDDVIDRIPGVNVFNKKQVINGKHVNRFNGTLVTNADYFTTDYIKITSLGLYAPLAVTGGDSLGYAAYDANYNYTHGGSFKQATYQDGDAYVRFSGYPQDINIFMVVRGTSADVPSEYVPYQEQGKLKENTVDTDNIKDDSVTFNKIAFKKPYAISTNLLNTNDDNYRHEATYYVNRNTGNVSHHSSAFSAFGYTGFIPVMKNGMYFNGYVRAGSYGGAVYDANKVYIRPTGAQYTYQEGDAYVRWTLAENPIAPYLAGQYMVWEGDGSITPEYDEYDVKEKIDVELLPPVAVTIEDDSISDEKLTEKLRNEIAGSGVEFCIPDSIPCVIGDTLRIYYRSIVKAPNPYIWDIIAISSVGRSFPRYFEFIPTESGNKTVTFYVRNANAKIVASKSVTINCVSSMSSPASNKNILLIGASTSADGTIASEINRRLTSNSGDGTPYNPTGLGLSNIAFVGRKTPSQHPEVHQEANSGWSWKDYATIGRYAYRFFVVGQIGIDIRPGAVYSGAGTLKFTISESDIDIDEETGTGYFTATYSGNGTQPATGTLSLYSGEGDATITYNSFELDSGNPFWNDTFNALDFVRYANNYCNGSIDILLSMVGLNDFTAVTEATMGERIETYVKPFIRAFHSQFPDSIVALCTLYLGSVDGGMAISYGASSAWNYYTTARKMWKWSELIRELAADEEFSEYVKVIDTITGFDAENLYPIGSRTVANRSERTEEIQTNGIHPTTNGKKTIADGIYEALNVILR